MKTTLLLRLRNLSCVGLLLAVLFGFFGEIASAQTSSRSRETLAEPQTPSTSPQRNSRKNSQKPQKQSQSRSASGVSAVIVTDGALVYTRPDFDAQVIGQIPAGKRVQVSRGTSGSLAKFHRIRLGKKLGFIADVDVKIEVAKDSTKDKTEARKQSANKNEAKSKQDRDKETESKERLPLFFTKYVGVLIGSSEYREAISGVDASTQLMTYGLKITGPDVLISGPVVDFNLALHYGAPSYYDPLSIVKPSGFLIFSDALFLLPLVGGDESFVFFGVGPLVVLSKFSVFNNNRRMDLTSLNLGASFALGGAVRFGKVALRLEAKYLNEKQAYKAIQAALQTEF